MGIFPAGNVLEVGSNFAGGDFPGANFLGGFFPGGIFPAGNVLGGPGGERQFCQFSRGLFSAEPFFPGAFFRTSL